MSAIGMLPNSIAGQACHVVDMSIQSSTFAKEHSRFVVLLYKYSIYIYIVNI